MNFEVVRSGLMCVCMNYSMHEARLLEESGGNAPSGTFFILGLLKSSLMRFLSKMAESCCESAFVLANYIVDSDAT